MKKQRTGIGKRIHRLFVFGLTGVGLLMMVVLLCNLMVVHSARGRTYDKLSDVPYREVGLVLGTTPRAKHGNVNYYYKCRMEAAAQLYFAHKVSYILVSGDNRRNNYNEPAEMRKSLIALGVPDSVIVLDYAGFRTYDSMIRAHKVFGQDSVTVISQPWHNKRAIFIARHRDLDAIGYNAKDSKVLRSYIKLHIREALSRVKAVIDVVTNKQPKFLGEPVQVSPNSVQDIGMAF